MTDKSEQLSRVIERDSIPDFKKLFSICTMVTDQAEYQRFCETARGQGFDDELCEYLQVDNTSGNTFDAFESVNVFLKHAQGRYVIVCHQDIEFNFDGIEKLKCLLDELEQSDPFWAIAGNAGIADNLKPHMHISEPNAEVMHLANNEKSMTSQLVMSLDENFLVFNNCYNVSASRTMRGFHLYGLDLCQNARSLGYSCYAIDFHLLHKSSGKKSAAFFDSKREMKAVMSQRKQGQLLKTTCTQFYSSGNSLIQLLCNLKPVLRKLVRLRRAS